MCLIEFYETRGHLDLAQGLTKAGLERVTSKDLRSGELYSYLPYSRRLGEGWGVPAVTAVLATSAVNAVVK